MRQFLISILLILSLIVSTETNGCTSAIITGKITADGRPLLWKHRDTGEDNNRIQYFKGEKFNFIALVNSPDEGGIIWMGTNDAGFSIMNTASYNLKDDKIKEMDKEGEIMFEALSVCKNISEFEEFLKNHKKPLRVEANFGVIDAEGGAAYFETNNTKYVKVDANDQRIAPEGYLIYTNYSYSGRFNEGMGYIRYQTASEIFSPQAVFMNITPQWIFDNLSRSYYHSLMGIDYKNPDFSPEKGRGWVIDQDFIPRKSSVASIVIQGVKPGENPEMTTMWTILGYPPAGVAIPLWVKTAENQPSVFLKYGDSQNAKACDLALSLKYKTFSLKRGNGPKYMYFPLIYNSNGTGYLQVLKNSEESIYSLFKEPIERWRKDGLNIDEIKQLNEKASQILVEGYSELL
ncbi:MAG: hypothetical protein ACD_77C00040G0006 [uncultured bacterium]|nr:MAG: hypothetical protein ACD_77C00040G0006 [uncultured bacterium]HBY01964.1 hypothetical protein [Rikenellaceae bacterium]